jgi:hypothetical protein
VINKHLPSLILGLKGFLNVIHGLLSRFQHSACLSKRTTTSSIWWCPSESVQLDLNLERLRVAVDDLLVKLARMFRKQKQQTIFLINNYDLILSVLKVGSDCSNYLLVISATCYGLRNLSSLMTNMCFCLIRRLAQMVEGHNYSLRNYWKVAPLCLWYVLYYFRSMDFIQISTFICT